MGKRVFSLVLVLALALGLCACGSKTPTWQEQYDLGVRYLSDGNYEEAILAFTAAIDIDPKRPDMPAGLPAVRSDPLAKAPVAEGESRNRFPARRLRYFT